MKLKALSIDPCYFGVISRSGTEPLNQNLDFLTTRFQCLSHDDFHVQGEEGEVPPLACKFCTVPGDEHLVAVASEDGDVFILDSNKKIKSGCLTSWKAHNNAVFDISWMPKEAKLVTASADLNLILWDVPSSQKLVSFKGHYSSVKCVDFRPLSKDVLASGARDGNINIWDQRCIRKDLHHMPENTIWNAHCATFQSTGTPRHKKKESTSGPSTNPLNSVTSLVFQDENLLVSSGTADGVIKVWDLRKTYSAHKKEATPRYRLPFCGESIKTHGFTSLALHPSRSCLFASCTDSIIYQYNCSSFDPWPLATYYGHLTSTLFVKTVLSQDGKYLLSGSSDEKGYIWKVSSPGAPISRLCGHRAEVTTVAWSPNDFSKIVTCGDDDRVLFWNIHENVEKQYSCSENGTHIIEGRAEKIDSSVIKKPSFLDKMNLPSTPVNHRKSCTFSPDSNIGVLSRTPKTPGNSKNINSSPAISSWFSPRTPKSLEDAKTARTPLTITKWFSPRTSQNLGSKSCSKVTTTPHSKSSLPSLDKTPTEVFSTAVDTATDKKSQLVRKRKLLNEVSEDQENLSGSEDVLVVQSPEHSRVLSPVKLNVVSPTALPLKQTRRSLNLDEVELTKSCSTKVDVLAENINLDLKVNEMPKKLTVENEPDCGVVFSSLNSNCHSGIQKSQIILKSKSCISGRKTRKVSKNKTNQIRPISHYFSIETTK
ncbi:denticleless protein homolog [Limulus polyphemus]|uniref:Denticleless protein homolog n=1 Tax=Limulus polyphemus TaxID=6850 RepID=A0ABM1SL49_LIMPO|nr:denticleless protein homolog [Limulus polyphemus]